VRCGGNKVRKLELLLATRASGAAPWSPWRIGSHHLVATAATGASWACPRAASSSPALDAGVVRNLEVLRPGGRRSACPRLWVPLALRRPAVTRPPYLICRWVLAARLRGYVSAALELAEQVRRQELPSPDHRRAVGSGGTCAGLALGLELGGLRSRIWAVRVVERALCNQTLLRWLIGRTARCLDRLR